MSTIREDKIVWTSLVNSDSCLGSWNRGLKSRTSCEFPGQCMTGLTLRRKFTSLYIFSPLLPCQLGCAQKTYTPNESCVVLLWCLATCWVPCHHLALWCHQGVAVSFRFRQSVPWWHALSWDDTFLGYVVCISQEASGVEEARVEAGARWILKTKVRNKKWLFRLWRGENWGVLYKGRCDLKKKSHYNIFLCVQGTKFVYHLVPFCLFVLGVSSTPDWNPIYGHSYWWTTAKLSNPPLPLHCVLRW